MRRRLLFALSLLASASTFAGTRVLPVAGHLPGANGTFWVTNISLTNRSTVAATVGLVFTAEDGVPRTRTVTLGAKQSQLLEDAVAPSHFGGANPAGWLGQLEIRSAADVAASAHIFTTAPDGGTYGSTFASVDPTVLSTRGAMAGLIASPELRTNVAFANPGAQVAIYQYTLWREDGSWAGAQFISVPPHSTRQVSIRDDILGPARTDGRFSLIWTGSVPGYVVASVIDNRTGDPASIPSVVSGALHLFFPVVGSAAGSLATFWSTSLAVSSVEGAPGSVTFVYRDSGTGLVYTNTLPIAARGMIVAADVNALVGAPAGQGSLEVRSTTRLVGAARVFHTRQDGATYGSAILPQEPVVASPAVRIEGVRRDEDYRLNVAVSNGGAAAAAGRVRLFDDSAIEIESVPFSAEAGQAVQVAMTQGGTVRAGAVEVSTSNGVPVFAIASNIDNRTGDTALREPEQENERQNDLRILMSAKSVAAGSFVTFSLSRTTDLISVLWDTGDGVKSTGTSATLSYRRPGTYTITVWATLISGAVVRDRTTVQVVPQ